MTVATAVPSMSATVVSVIATTSAMVTTTASLPSALISATTTIAMKLWPATTVVTIIKVATTIINYPAVAVASPIVGISYITAVTDNNLVMTAPVAGILRSVNVMP